MIAKVLYQLLARTISWWDLKVVSDLVKSGQNKLPRADFALQ